MLFFCLFSKKREKEGLKLGGWGEENQGGDEEWKTVNRINCTKSVFNKINKHRIIYIFGKDTWCQGIFKQKLKGLSYIILSNVVAGDKY